MVIVMIDNVDLKYNVMPFCLLMYSSCICGVVGRTVHPACRRSRNRIPIVTETPLPYIRQWVFIDYLKNACPVLQQMASLLNGHERHFHCTHESLSHSLSLSLSLSDTGPFPRSLSVQKCNQGPCKQLKISFLRWIINT